MNYLQVENLSKSYGEKVLFENISFSIDKGQKVALIARNGTGKSTLMNIIAGKDAPDSGSITFRNDIKVNYLLQNPLFNESQTILDVIFNTDTTEGKIIHDYEYALQQIHSNPCDENTALLNQSMAEMDAASAWDYETKVKEILGLFNIHDLMQTIGSLSGGQLKKIALAKALLGKPDLLILDEPTNHLDFSMIEWLEEYLSRESLSLLLVTHDRYFLDNVCDVIVELEDSKVYTYKGNYSYFLEKKAERQQIENAATDKARNLYRTELEWIRRMPKARGTKSKARIDAFKDLSEKAAYKSQENEIKFKVEEKKLGGKIIEINNISKNFGDKKYIDNFSYIFKKGEKIGIVGLNGTGKSTLLNIIAGTLRPDVGHITHGQTVVLSYYTQDGLTLKEDKRVIDIVKDVAEEIKMEKSSMSASQFLFHFNFSYPVQQAYFSSLSGGEKRRLYLLLQLIKNPNVLLLDEPTNDLDINTIQVLENFLQDFSGCAVIVSHDRFLLDKVCDHVFVFEENGKIKDFYGNYTAYYRQRIAEQKKKNQEEKEKKEAACQVQKEKKTPSKPSYKQLKEYETLEAKIEELEKEKSNVLEKLNNGNTSIEELQNLSVRFGEIENELEEKSMQWLELGEIIESMNRSM